MTEDRPLAVGEVGGDGDGGVDHSGFGVPKSPDDDVPSTIDGGGPVGGLEDDVDGHPWFEAFAGDVARSPGWGLVGSRVMRLASL